MENIVLENTISWTVIWSFLSCVLLVMVSLAILFIRDNREKQKLYRLFDGHMGEYIVVLSSKMEFLYGLPLFSSDPFFKILYRERSFENFLPAADWIRISDYFKDTDKHLNMPFIFSYEDGSEFPIWYELRCVKKYYSSVEFHYICFVRNISREVEIRKGKEETELKLKLFLENTGDFICKFDIEKRKLSILTPVSADELKIIPISMGDVDILSLIPEQEYNLLLNQFNQRVIIYQRTGKLSDGNIVTRIRGYRTDESLVWYSLYCKLEKGDDNHLYYQIIARHIDFTNSVPFISSQDEKEIFFMAFMMLSDIRIFWMDRNFVVLGGNQAFALDVGLNDTKTMVGKSVNELVSTLFPSIFIKKLGDVFELQRNVSWRESYLRSQQSILFNAVPLNDQNNVVQRVLCVYTILDKKILKSEV